MTGLNSAWQIILFLGVTYVILMAIALWIGKKVEKWINDNIG